MGSQWREARWGEIIMVSFVCTLVQWIIYYRIQFVVLFWSDWSKGAAFYRFGRWGSAAKIYTFGLHLWLSEWDQTAQWKTLTDWTLSTNGTLNSIIINNNNALINALSAHMIHVNLNMIFLTYVEHSPTETIYITDKVLYGRSFPFQNVLSIKSLVCVSVL